MNLLHLVDEPYDSGIVHYALTVARGLKDRGHDVRIGGLPGQPPLQQAARLGLETISLRGFPIGTIGLRRLLRNRRFDCINAHTGSSHTLAAAAILGLADAPAIVRTRGDSRLLRRNPGSTLLWRKTSGFIAATEAILSDYRAAYPRTEVLARVVLPGLPDAAGGPAKEPGDGPLRAGIVGRLDPVKGHIHFLRAAAQVRREIPNAAFVAAGREENVNIGNLREAARELGLSDAVEFLGHAPDALAVMRRCHVGVIASIGSEAISRAAIEWMSLGRPVVATSVGSLPELVVDGENGFLVPPQNPEAMAERLLRLFKDAKLRRQMGGEARKRYETRFTLSRLVDDTEKFYEETLRGIPSR